MKRSVFLLTIVAAALAGCASSNTQQQKQNTGYDLGPGTEINEPAGAEYPGTGTNTVDSQARDVNQRPYGQPWGDLHW